MHKKKFFAVTFLVAIVCFSFACLRSILFDRLFCETSTTYESSKQGAYVIRLTDSHAGAQLCDDRFSAYFPSREPDKGGWHNFFSVSRSYLQRDDRSKFIWVDPDHLLVIVDDIARIDVSLRKVGSVTVNYALSERLGSSFESREKRAYEAQIRLDQSGQFSATNSVEDINRTYHIRRELYLELDSWFKRISGSP